VRVSGSDDTIGDQLLIGYWAEDFYTGRVKIVNRVDGNFKKTGKFKMD